MYDGLAKELWNGCKREDWSTWALLDRATHGTMATLFKQGDRLDWTEVYAVTTGGTFPKVIIKHLPHSYSNHCSLPLQFGEESPCQLGRRPFRCQAAWFSHRSFLPFYLGN